MRENILSYWEEVELWLLSPIFFPYFTIIFPLFHLYVHHILLLCPPIFPISPYITFIFPIFSCFPFAMCLQIICNISSLYKTYVKVGIVNRFPTIPLLFLLYSSNITPHPHFTFIFSLLYLYFPPILCRFSPIFYLWLFSMQYLWTFSIC